QGLATGPRTWNQLRTFHAVGTAICSSSVTRLERVLVFAVEPDGAASVVVSRKEQPMSSTDSRYPFSMPSGWFAVAETPDVAIGQTKAVYYFATHLVVWRDET